MKTLIINGSPKAKNGNTEIFIQEFMKGMKSPCEVRYAARESSQQIAEELKQFDTLIVAMPLYIHAMPGIVMKIFELMEPASDEGKSMGFIVQSGFIESGQSKYLEQYLSSLTERLNYTYLGTVIKGGSAGVYMIPENMNKKLFNQLQNLGGHFELESSFHPDVVKKLASPQMLSKRKARLFQLFYKVGLGDSIFWRMLLKKNQAWGKKFDRPFADKRG